MPPNVTDSGRRGAKLGRGIVGRSKRTVTRWLQDPELRLIAEREGAVPGEAAPVEMSRAALHATKASGQPDWAARLSAVRALAALPPEEVEPEAAHRPSTPSIIHPSARSPSSSETNPSLPSGPAVQRRISTATTWLLAPLAANADASATSGGAKNEA